MFLINGVQSQYIDVADRGFQYGDGLFETIEVLNGKPLFLERHLKRLESGCLKLLIPPPDMALLAQESLQFSAAASHAVLKLIFTRGCGGRGYRQPSSILPSRVLGLYPYPDYPDHFQNDGVTLRFCRQRLAINPVLAGIKHMNRLEQILARAEWQDDDIPEGLMMDNHGRIIEGTMSNVFLIKDGALFTPDLSECGVAGIVREVVTELAQLASIPLREAQLDKHMLLQADEIFITNSIIGVLPVNRIEQYRFGVGGKTRKLQKMYNAMRISGA